jgi:hypothetical protein
LAAAPRPHPADSEFDAAPAPPLRLRDFDPPEHQRLVVNPFLAVLGLLGLGWLARELALSPLPALAGLLILPMVMLPYLIQYHCLDCGRTGPYPRHRRHACPGVVARWGEGRRRRVPFPTPWAQLVVWGWLLGAVGLLLAVIGFSRTMD